MHRKHKYYQENKKENKKNLRRLVKNSYKELARLT